jgi:signal peptidase II
VRVLYATVLIVLADQVTKLLVKGVAFSSLGLDWKGMDYGQSIQVIGDFFRLTYIENPGMAFGLDFGWKPLFSILSIVASIGIIVFLYNQRRESFGFRLSLGLILGGAVGNLIDRVFYGVIFGEGRIFQGRVVDFLDVDFFDLNIFGYQITRWPVFNVADAAVTIGVVMLLLFHRTVEHHNSEHPQQ